MTPTAPKKITAELSSPLTWARLEITNGPRPDHVRYLAHWLDRAGKNPSDIFSAAITAQAATDYLCGLQPQAEPAAARIASAGAVPVASVCR